MSGTLGGERPPRPSALTLSRIALGCGSFGGSRSAPGAFSPRPYEQPSPPGADAAPPRRLPHPLLPRQGEREVLPLAPRRQLASLAFSPLAGGRLTGKYRRGEPSPAGSRMTQRPEPYTELVTGRTFDALDRLQAIASSRGISMAGAALGWLLAGERVTQIVVGPGRPEHLPPVGEALEHPLTAEDWAAAERAFG